MKKSFLFLVLMLPLLFSCNRQQISEDNEARVKGNWQLQNPPDPALNLNFEINDSTLISCVSREDSDEPGKLDDGPWSIKGNILTLTLNGQSQKCAISWDKKGDMILTSDGEAMIFAIKDGPNDHFLKNYENASKTKEQSISQPSQQEEATPQSENHNPFH